VLLLYLAVQQYGLGFLTITVAKSLTHTAIYCIHTAFKLDFEDMFTNRRGSHLVSTVIFTVIKILYKTVFIAAFTEEATDDFCKVMQI